MSDETETSGTTSTAEPPPAALPGRTRATWRRHAIALAVVAGLIALDLWSKSHVFELLDPKGDPDPGLKYGVSEDGHPRISLLGDWLGFMLNLNYGAAFGQGSGFQGALVIGRIVAAVFLSFLIVRAPIGQRAYLSALVLVLAGALGNLYDNLFYEPHDGVPGFLEGREYAPVRDFIDVYFSVWDWHFPTFNVADSCITVGAILLVLAGFFGGSSEAPEPSAAE